MRAEDSDELILAWLQEGQSALRSIAYLLKDRGEDGRVRAVVSVSEFAGELLRFCEREIAGVARSRSVPP